MVAELQRLDITVRALARPESNQGGFATPPEWVTGSLLSDAALTALVTGADAVVHLAYEHVPGRYRGGEGDNLSAWLNVNVNGSLRLITAARAAGVKQFVFLSSRAVFSRTEPGRVLDETHPTSPDSHYGAYKVAVEAFLSSFAAVDGMRTCSLRATGVYGLTWPIEHSKWWNLINAVLRDEPIASNNGGTEIHGEDVARVIGKVLTQPGPAIDVIHLSDLYITHRDVVRLAREFTGHPGLLPNLPLAPPTNVLVSRRLPEIGLSLGGIPLLEKTVAALVRAAQTQQRRV